MALSCFLLVFFSLRINEIPEPIRLTLFTSILEDGGIYCYAHTIDRKIECMENFYSYLEIDAVTLKSEFPVSFRKPFTLYEINLYRIDTGVESCLRYMLEYKDIDSQAWYRIQGYQETDFHHFYNRVLLKYVSKKDLNSVFAEWSSEASLFEDLDFDCLINGIKKSKLVGDCYLSAVKAFNKYSFSHPESIPKDQLYNSVSATLSQRPYRGSLPPK